MKNSRSRLIILSLTILIFLFVIGVFIRGLSKDPSKQESVVANNQISITEQNNHQPRIHFNITELGTDKIITVNEMPEPPYLINIWGTWCPVCYVEHPFLLELGKKIPIIGVNWPGDNGEKEEDLAKKFLQERGNPYTITLIDKKNELILDLGVYGAPETFIIGKDQKILKRHASALTEEVWQNEFLPILMKEGYKNE